MNTRLHKWFGACALPLILLGFSIVFGPSQAEAQRDYEYIDISNPFLRKIPIATPVFAAASDDPNVVEMADKASRILSESLEFTGYFKIIDAIAYLEEPRRVGVTAADLQFRNWTVIGAEMLITGAVAYVDGLVQLDMRLFDTFKEDLLVGKRYRGAPEDSRRKLRYTLELLEIDGQRIGANTIVPNRLAELCVRAGVIPGLRRFRSLRREVRYGEKSRIDLLLRGTVDHLVEVKNCHLVYPDGGAYFPDSVSARAAGHLDELTRETAAGRKATVLFVLQRDDASFLRPSRLHDPAFAAAATRAAAAGVRFRAVMVAPEPDGFHLRGLLPVDLKPYDPATIAPFREALRPYSGWQRRGRGTG